MGSTPDLLNQRLWDGAKNLHPLNTPESFYMVGRLVFGILTPHAGSVRLA